MINKNKGFYMNSKLKEELTFSLLMMVGMVTIMLTYNSILVSGLSFSALRMIIGQFIPIFIAVFIIEQFFVSHNVHKLHKILVAPSDPKFKYEITMTLLIVTMMCLSMTLYTTLIYVGTENNFWQHYLAAVIRNYPVALLSQLFVVGPLVRRIHKNIFYKTKLVY